MGSVKYGPVCMWILPIEYFVNVFLQSVSLKTIAVYSFVDTSDKNNDNSNNNSRIVGNIAIEFAQKRNGKV